MFKTLEKLVVVAVLFGIFTTSANSHFREYNENKLYHTLYGKYPIVEPTKGVKLHAPMKGDDLFVQVVDLENANLQLLGDENKYKFKTLKTWKKTEGTFSVMNGMPFDKATHLLCVGDKKGFVYEKENVKSEDCHYSIPLLHSKYVSKDVVMDRIYVAPSKDGDAVVFFIAKAKTHAEMLVLAEEWLITDKNKLFFIETNGNTHFSTKKFDLHKEGGKLSHVIITKPKG